LQQHKPHKPQQAQAHQVLSQEKQLVVTLRQLVEEMAVNLDQEWINPRCQDHHNLFTGHSYLKRKREMLRALEQVSETVNMNIYNLVLLLLYYKKLLMLSSLSLKDTPYNLKTKC
jgi:hypothetical protein